MNTVSNNPRAEETQARRRRRSEDYRGYNLRLEVPEQLKDPNYRYYWCNDEKGKLQYRTTQDDWDFVDGKELGIASHEYDSAKDANQSDGRIRRVVDSATASRPVYAYLLKKRKDFDAADFKTEMQMVKDRRAGMIRSQRAGMNEENGEDARDFNDRSYIPGEVQQAIETTERRIRRAGGWPKGKPRGPRRPGSGGPLDSEDGD